VAQRVGRSIALLFHGLGTRRGLVVRSTHRPHFTPGRDPVPIVEEAGWAPEPVWTGAENIAPTGIRSPDRPARSQSLYRLSYPVHDRLIWLWSICGMIPTKENRRTRKNSCPRANLTKIQHAMAWDSNQVSAVRRRNLTAFDMARLTYSSPKTQLQLRDGAVDIS
jgi:hypothetical protein